MTNLGSVNKAMTLTAAGYKPCEPTSQSATGNSNSVDAI